MRSAAARASPEDAAVSSSEPLQPNVSSPLEAGVAVSAGSPAPVEVGSVGFVLSSIASILSASGGGHCRPRVENSLSRSVDDGPRADPARDVRLVHVAERSVGLVDRIAGEGQAELAAA